MNDKLKPILDMWEDYKKTMRASHNMNRETEEILYLAFLTGAGVALRDYKGSTDVFIAFLLDENNRLNPTKRN